MVTYESNKQLGEHLETDKREIIAHRRGIKVLNINKRVTDQGVDLELTDEEGHLHQNQDLNWNPEVSYMDGGRALSIVKSYNPDAKTRTLTVPKGVNFNGFDKYMKACGITFLYIKEQIRLHNLDLLHEVVCDYLSSIGLICSSDELVSFYSYNKERFDEAVKGIIDHSWLIGENCFLNSTYSLNTLSEFCEVTPQDMYQIAHRTEVKPKIASTRRFIQDEDGNTVEEIRTPYPRLDAVTLNREGKVIPSVLDRLISKINHYKDYCLEVSVYAARYVAFSKLVNKRWLPEAKAEYEADCLVESYDEDMNAPDLLTEEEEQRLYEDEQCLYELNQFIGEECYYHSIDEDVSYV